MQLVNELISNFKIVLDTLSQWMGLYLFTATFLTAVAHFRNEPNPLNSYVRKMLVILTIVGLMVLVLWIGKPSGNLVQLVLSLAIIPFAFTLGLIFSLLKIIERVRDVISTPSLAQDSVAAELIGTSSPQPSHAANSAIITANSKPREPNAVNKIEAQAAMNTAQQYLEKIAADTGNKEARQWLKFAASYAAKARELDPNAMLVMPDGDSYVTIDHMTARILFIEGVLDYGTDYKKAAAAVEKAIAYYPEGNFYPLLAKTYAQLHRRNDAITALQTNLTRDPKNFDARSLLDKIIANPAIGVKPSIIASHPGLFVGLGVLFGAVGLLYWITSPFGLYIAIVGGVMFFIGKLSENQKGLLDAIDDLDGQVRNTL